MVKSNTGLDPPRKKSRKPLPVAGLVVAAVVIAALVFFVRSRQAPQEEAAADAVEATQKSEDNLKAETFAFLHQLIAEFPSDTYPLALMGTAHNSYGNTVEAEEWWQKCLEREPSRADVYNVLATAALRKAEYEKVAELMQKAKAIDPNLPGMHRFYGEALMEMGQLDEALATLEQELEVSSDESVTYLLIGKVQLQRGEYQKAIEAYDRARRLRPTDSRPHYGLGSAAARLGRPDEARKHMETFSRLRADEDKFLTTRRRAGGKPPRAARILAETLTDAGRLYSTHRQFDRAEASWQRAGKLDRLNTACRLELVRLYRRAQRVPEALEVCQQLREIDPANARYQLSAGILLAQQSQFDAAEEAMRKAIELAPEFVAARRTLIEFLLSRNRKLPESKMLAQQLVALDGNARHYSLLGQACFRNEDRDGALAAMKRAVELAPDNEDLQQAYKTLQEGPCRRKARNLEALNRCAAVAMVCALVALPARAESPIQLREVTGLTGIDFKHEDGGGGKRYIVEVMSAGVAVFDYDRDGDMDVYFLNGAALEGTKLDVAPTNQLYRNDGGFKFTKVTEAAGVGDKGFGLGVAVGDYDNDGDPDVYINNYGPNVLYRNDGDGTFTDVTKDAGVGNGHQVGAGANFLDIDKDGDLDLFAGNYIAWTEADHVERFFGQWMVYPGPRDYLRNSSTLYRNDGGGVFTDISEASGIAAHEGSGMGTVCADTDNDGDTDIVVCNDDWGNFLFQNDGTGKFTEVGLASGIALDLGGSAHSSMGVTCGDYNNDGTLDLHMTSYQTELATLYENIGGGFFSDVTRVSGAGIGTLVHVTWGNGLVDLDNDGDLDIFIACGHLNDLVEEFSDMATYAARNVVLMNTGDGKFVDVSDQCGDGLAPKLVSRGAAFEDLDNDGDLDVVVLNSRKGPTILRNDSPPGNHWTQIRLRGAKSNRDGVGAHVTVVTGNLSRVAEVHSGQGYQSHYGMRLHFGLGVRDRVDRVEVRWIGGGVDVIDNVPIDRALTIAEGQGLVDN